MGISYDINECAKRIKDVYESKNLNGLYSPEKNEFISWNGNIKNTKVLYQEFFSLYIYGSLNKKGELPYIDKANYANYCKVKRNIEKNADGEERIQREYFVNIRHMPIDLGKPIWFELPTHKDGDGKGIDLVYYNDATTPKTLSIIELKYNADDTLLRTILEIQTYYQRVSWNQAIKDINEATGENIPSNGILIKKYIMINSKCKMSSTLQKIEKYEYLNRMMKIFDIGVIRYEE